MKRTFFAKPGTDEQLIDMRDAPACPEGFINMQSERPETGDWLAQADGTWLEKVISLAEAKHHKLTEINEWADCELCFITDEYPETEIKSWDKQEAEARKLLADSHSHAPLLNAIARQRHINLITLAEKVVIKADAFAELSGSVFGRRQLLEDQVNTATTIKDVEAITYE
ncbi:hypothetical protein [Endozoicomonas ascidiicola]|uniref:hypothetical protein n=1 Tax=Endozoicomonas ascidiicola TaxID=1698521 RepID=UPI00082D3A4A|nr:hypothetical protein [Endozoicomonas ascidiicola]